MAKQKIYKSKTPDMFDYRPISRYIKIRFNSETEPYFIYNGRREYIDSYDNLLYPVMLEDNDGKLIVIGLYKTVCNFGGVLLEIEPNCEYVRVWEEIPNENN